MEVSFGLFMGFTGFLKTVIGVVNVARLKLMTRGRVSEDRPCRAIGILGQLRYLHERDSSPNLSNEL